MISIDRILGCDHHQVRTRARENHTGGKRTITLPAAEFIGRFLRHVRPPGFKRIRHKGLLAANHNRPHFPAAREALKIPKPPQMAIKAAEAFFARVSGHDPCRCAYCEHGRRRPAVAPGHHEADLLQCNHYQRRPMSAAQDPLRALSGERAETP